ncbi:MAG TPA: alpha/beta hydrolase-fold protein [Mycobacteriales bacterium]|nr:alpha/beta hydrolase-fold protein [Mycobacteriales bacterium]
MLNRRQLLGGLAGVAGATVVGASSSGVRRRVHELLEPAPEPLHPVPVGAVGSLVEDTFASAAMRRDVSFTTAYPGEVVAGLPVLLQLHGRGDDHRDAFRAHHLDAFLSDAVRRGVPPFAVVAPDGGDHSYWHRRAGGLDPLRMVVDELLPRLARKGLVVDRIAVGGWSMGGYGALLLAETLGRSRVAALVPDSPAVFRGWEDAAGGAFDSREDFDAHDVLARADELAGIPTRVTCGTADPFLGQVRELLRRVPAAERQLEPGGHDSAWWQHVAPAQLAFAGRALALG